MAGELKDQRVVTMMTPTELEAIDDWMFANRIRSRGEAIRRLCQIGLLFDRQADGIYQEYESTYKEFASEMLKAGKMFEKIGPDLDVGGGAYIKKTIELQLDTLRNLGKLSHRLDMALLPLQELKGGESIEEAKNAASSAGSQALVDYVKAQIEHYESDQRLRGLATGAGDNGGGTPFDD